MKTIKITKAAFGILLAGSLAFLTSCKDDDNNGPGQAWRVIGMEYPSEGSFAGKATMVYEGEKVVRFDIFDTEAGGDSVKNIVTYPESNKTIITTYEIWMGQQEEVSREDQQLANGKVTQSVMYEKWSGNWEPVEKVDMEYQDGRMVMETWSGIEGGVWAQYFRSQYEYSGDKLTLSTYFVWSGTAWMEMGQEERTYDGDRLVNATFYYTLGGLHEMQSKTECQYDGDLMVQVTNYTYVSGAWFADGAPLEITYDTHGNVASWSDPDEVFNGSAEFTYEEGKGNFRETFLYSKFIFGDVVPYPTKASYADKVKMFHTEGHRGQI